jgi:hypothetical protein
MTVGLSSDSPSKDSLLGLIDGREAKSFMSQSIPVMVTYLKYLKYLINCPDSSCTFENSLGLVTPFLTFSQEKFIILSIKSIKKFKPEGN